MEESPKSGKEVGPRKRKAITEKQAAARNAQAVIEDMVRAEIDKEWITTSDYPKYMLIGRMLAKALGEAMGDTDEKRLVSAVLDKAASWECQEKAIERVLRAMYQDRAQVEVEVEVKTRIKEMGESMIEEWKSRFTTKDTKAGAAGEVQVEVEVEKSHHKGHEGQEQEYGIQNTEYRVQDTESMPSIDDQGTKHDERGTMNQEPGTNAEVGAKSERESGPATVSPQEAQGLRELPAWYVKAGDGEREIEEKAKLLLQTESVAPADYVSYINFAQQVAEAKYLPKGLEDARRRLAKVLDKARKRKCQEAVLIRILGEMFIIKEDGNYVDGLW